MRWLAHFQHPLFRHGSWAVGGSFFHAATGFIANLTLVRFLAPEDFGRFAIVQANIALVATIFSLHLTTLLLRESEKELQDDNRDIYLNALTVEIAVVGMVGFVALWLLGLWGVWAATLLFGQLVHIWTHAQKIMYERKFHYKSLSVLESGTYLVSYAFAVVGVIMGLGALVLYLRIWILVIGQLVWLHRAGGVLKLRWRWLAASEWRHVVRQVRKFWMDAVLDQSYDRVAVLLVGVLASERVTGYFFQAYKLVSTLHQLLRPLAERVLFNYLNHRVSAERRLALVKKLVAIEAALLSVAAIATAICAGILIPLIFGPEWEPVVPLLQGMSGVIACATMFSSLRAYFKAEGHMLPFTVWGRGGQYLAPGIAAGGTLFFHFDAALMIALGMSAGFLIGVVLSYSAACYKGNDARLICIKKMF